MKLNLFNNLMKKVENNDILMAFVFFGMPMLLAPAIGMMAIFEKNYYLIPIAMVCLLPVVYCVQYLRNN